MKILTIAKRFNKYNLSNFTPIRIGKISIGWVKKENIKFLKQFSDFFLINKNSIMIRSELNTAKKLNSIFDIVISDLTHKKILQKGKNESLTAYKLRCFLGFFDDLLNFLFILCHELKQREFYKLCSDEFFLTTVNVFNKTGQIIKIGILSIGFSGPESNSANCE